MVDKIFEDFQLWLDSRNSKIHPILEEYKGFLPPDEEFGKYREGQKELPNEHIPFPIQQVEAEIKTLVSDILEKLEHFDHALEIGMGEFGGTHMLFRSIFDKVTTIEIQHPLVSNFQFREKNVLDDSKDIILNANSNHIPSLPQIYVNKFDFLFIDGEHSYLQTKNDFLNCYPYIKDGGIIAFHDANNPKYGVQLFLEHLAQGNINGTKYNITNIFHSLETGISYLQK